MKKIWLLLLLLLLLIIICVWTKKDSIHVSSNTTTNTVAPVIIDKKKEHINYLITQKGNSYTLEGKFKNQEQQNSLTNIFATKKSPLRINHSSTDDSLIGEEAITLTNKIIPLFIKNYKNGTISYHDQKLEVTGNVDNYETKREIQRILAISTVPSKDNTVVVLAKPINFKLIKDGDRINFTGILKDDAQTTALLSKIPNSFSIEKSVTQEEYRTDNGAITTTAHILPNFLKEYNKGEIEYTNGTLTISGMVETKEALEQMKKLTSSSTNSLSIVNKTTLDLEALKRIEAEANKAKLAAEAKAREEEANKAKLEAEAKAKKEALEAEAKAREAEANKTKVEVNQTKVTPEAKIQETKVKAKAVINQLLSVSDIEFKVSKSSLTEKGKNTVDKLANILKQYPDIRVELAGYTDSDGSESFNQRLSQSRVDTTKNRLVAKGISANRLVAKGYGEANPLVPNTSDANKQINRRVEIKILGE